MQRYSEVLILVLMEYGLGGDNINGRKVMQALS